MLEVWDPAHDRVVRRIGTGTVVVAAGAYVAWTEPNCDEKCGIRLTDVRTGADRTLPPPVGMMWNPSAPEVAFSPDATHLALVARPLLTRGGRRGSSGRSRTARGRP